MNLAQKRSKDNFELAKEYVAGGMRVTDAIKKSHISANTYYKYEHENPKGESQTPAAVAKRAYRKKSNHGYRVTELQDKSTTNRKVFMFYGDASEIAETIRRLES